MTAFIIIILIFLLIMLIPVGIAADYDSNGFKLRLKIAFIKISPDFSKKKKEKKKRTKKKHKLDFTLDEWLETIRLVLQTVGRLGKKLVCERLKFVFVSSADDPYDAAMRYNTVSAALHTLVPLIKQKLTVKNTDIRLSTDYDSGKSIIEAGITLTLRIGWFVLIAPAAAVSFVKILSESKKRRKG